MKDSNYDDRADRRAESPSDGSDNTHEWTPDELNALKETFQAPSFPGSEIEARLEQSVREAGRSRTRGSTHSIWASPVMRTVLAAAAALVLFIGGAEYGRRTAAPVTVLAEGAFNPSTSELALPISIQTAGSDYIATLAQYSDQASSLTEAERQEAQDVALAVLYGVVIELLRESGDDDMLATIAQLLHSRRQSLRNPELEGVIWF